MSCVWSEDSPCSIQIYGDSLELKWGAKSRFEKIEIGFSFDIAVDNLSLKPSLFIDSYDPETDDDATVHAKIEEDSEVVDVDIEVFDILRSGIKVDRYFSDAWEAYPEIEDSRALLLGTLHKYLTEHYKINATIEWCSEELGIDVVFKRHGVQVISLDFRIPQEEANKVVRCILE